MTELYYPVTRDELNKIKNDCIHPASDGCPDDCENLDEEIGCKFSANALMEEVLDRKPISL